MKQFQLLISLNYYQEYILSEEDAIRLLKIAGRAIKVTRTGYSGPYHPVPENEQKPFIESASVVEVEFS